MKCLIFSLFFSATSPYCLGLQTRMQKKRQKAFSEEILQLKLEFPLEQNYFICYLTTDLCIQKPKILNEEHYVLVANAYYDISRKICAVLT